MDHSWDISIKNWMGPNPNGPQSRRSYWSPQVVRETWVRPLEMSEYHHSEFSYVLENWWLNQPISKIMLVNLDHETPSFGMNIKKYLSCHHQFLIVGWVGGWNPLLLLKIPTVINVQTLSRSTRQTMGMVQINCRVLKGGGVQGEGVTWEP